MARLLFFGKLGDIAGGRSRELTLEPDTKTVMQLVEFIGKIDSALGAALLETSVRFIVNEQIVSPTHSIANGDEIAFLPPVSGG
ncbi:MAG: MoaD/ThiS family protein [Alphaproteobacteria bacterium]|nr:MoaD/ThiS family protein [Alphaproteobacteria bacterium]